jgi:hypothetical protein
MSPVRYELDFYIPEDDILHSHRREYLISYKLLLIAAFMAYAANTSSETSVNLYYAVRHQKTALQ